MLNVPDPHVVDTRGLNYVHRAQATSLLFLMLEDVELGKL